MFNIYINKFNTRNEWKVLQTCIKPKSPVTFAFCVSVALKKSLSLTRSYKAITLFLQQSELSVSLRFYVCTMKGIKLLGLHSCAAFSCAWEQSLQVMQKVKSTHITETNSSREVANDQQSHSKPDVRPFPSLLYTPGTSTAPISVRARAGLSPC